MIDVHQWARDGRYDLPKEIDNCTIPQCNACLFAEVKRRTKGKGKIAQDANKPGDFVSVDVMVSGIPGYIPFLVGRPSNRRYIGSNLCVDYHTKFLWTDHHEAANTKTALSSKIKFELFAKQYNVDVKHIHSDNGAFSSKAFVDNCDSSLQKHTLCDIGQHQQNGPVKRYIGALTGKARTMLLHAMRHWSTVITPTYWPFAFSYTKTVHNITPLQGEEKCPRELFTDEVPPNRHQYFRVWGCPAYVLSKSMQDGKATGKFSKDKSYLGVIVGLLPVHAGSVPIIFNPKIKLVSPPFHVIFDERFDTAFAEDSVELQDKIFYSLMKFSENQEGWIYIDRFVDNYSNQFFNAAWDHDSVVQVLKAKRKAVQTVLAREIERNSELRLKLGMQIGLEGGLPSETGNISDSDFSTSTRISSATKKRNRESQYSYGKVSFDSDRNITWERTKRPPHQPPNKKKNC